jgi:hypothetical protein
MTVCAALDAGPCLGTAPTLQFLYLRQALSRTFEGPAAVGGRTVLSTYCTYYVTIIKPVPVGDSR